MKPHIKTALQWGIIGGMIMAILGLLVYLISPSSTGNNKWANFFYIPLLFCMVWGVVTVKKNQGDEITFGRAFLVTFLISLVAVTISSTFSIALITWIDPQLGHTIYENAVDKAREGWEQRGMTDEQMEVAEGYIKFFFKVPVMFAFLIVWQGFIGSIISLIIAAFVKRKNENAELITDQPSSN